MTALHAPEKHTLSSIHSMCEMGLGADVNTVQLHGPANACSKCKLANSTISSTSLSQYPNCTECFRVGWESCGLLYDVGLQLQSILTLDQATGANEN